MTGEAGSRFAGSIDWPAPAAAAPSCGFLLLIVVVAGILFGGQTALSYWVDLLWFRSLGYGDVFWKTLSLQWGIFAIFAVATFLILYGAFLRSQAGPSSRSAERSQDYLRRDSR